LWKDGIVQSDLRNFYAMNSLRQYNMLDGLSRSASEEIVEKQHSSVYNAIDVVEYDFPIDSVSDSGTDEAEHVEQNAEFPIPKPPLPPRASWGPTTIPKEIPSNTHNNTWSAVTAKKAVHVPEFIYSHAEVLRKEKKMTLEEISDYLRKVGHGENVISAIVTKQAATLQDEI